MVPQNQEKLLSFLLICPKCGSVSRAISKTVDIDIDDQSDKFPGLIIIVCEECGYVDSF